MSDALPESLLKFRSYQREPFWRDDIRVQLWRWSRQKGKTTTLSRRRLRRMMQVKALKCVYCSASLSMGREIIENNAFIFHESLSKFRELCERSQMMMEWTAQNGTYDDFVEIFEKRALEVRIYHDRTTYSRLKVIAPNPATARGFTGDVDWDEFGWTPECREMWDAMEPIISSDPNFRLTMATTPPLDDSHYSYEMMVAEDESAFKVNPEGTWYKSKSGIWCHRVDAWDAHSAGVPAYDKDTGEKLTPEQHLAQYLDKDSWWRNYGVRLIQGGTSAISLPALESAQARSRTIPCVAAQDDLPDDWYRVLGFGEIGIGVDLATTEGEKSNPTAIVVTERVGSLYAARLIFRFKSADPAKTIRMLAAVLADIAAAKRRPRRICIDATNERFFAIDLRKKFRASCPVELVIGSETKEYKGESMTMKEYLGNVGANTIEDNLAVLPNAKWVENDFRLVKKRKGRFDNAIDAAGNHGDGFDGWKNSLKALSGTGGGPAEAHACSPGSFYGGPSGPTRKSPWGSQRTPEPQLIY